MDSEKTARMDWTGTQLLAAREALRNRAESLLGRFLFEFANLETGLDLCLVWVDQGRQLEERTRKLEDDSNFHRKLVMLDTDLRNAPSEKGKKAYQAWILRAHDIRLLRNVLVHGRLGLDVRDGSLTIVTSRATSDITRSRTLSLSEVEEHIAEIKRLVHDLNALRSAYPL